MTIRDRAVVARLSSGLVLRGTTVDFNPDRPTLWITPDGGGRGVEIRVADLKALFFPRPASAPSPAGRMASNEAGRGPHPERDGKRIVARFHDGELMSGYALAYRPEKNGFFLFPDDPDTQHEKVFILATSCIEVLVGQEALEHPVVTRRQPSPPQNKAA